MSVAAACTYDYFSRREFRQRSDTDCMDKERSQKWRFTSIRANIRVTLIGIECLMSHSSAHTVIEQECPRCDK